MPSKTPKQERFMAMCAHNPKHARGKCPPMKVSKEYNEADARAGRAAAAKGKLSGQKG